MTAQPLAASKSKLKQKDRAVARAVKAAVRAFDPTAQVVLFGSRARGEARADSDYDFLVLLNLPIDFQLKNKVLDSIYEVELATNTVIGPLIRNQTEWSKMTAFPIFQEISTDGVAI